MHIDPQVTEFEHPVLFLLSALFFIVAILYSSVGHGGASGYLAVLSFTGATPDEMASTALLLNVFVAGIAFVNYLKAGFFSWRLTLPFIITSIPSAFIGGLLNVPVMWYQGLLAIVLFIAGLRLSFPQPGAPDDSTFPRITLKASLPSGAGIGFISGMVGVGGGIFLSPLMLLMKWAGPKSTAAASALFIVVNAIAGIAGRVARDGFHIGNMWTLLLAAVAGAFIGSTLGSRQLSGLAVRRLLSVVLLVASFKLFVQLFIFAG